MADDGIHISEEEQDRILKGNVERWVSGHIIPVRRASRGLVEYDSHLINS